MIGIDIQEVERFEKIDLEKLKRIFSQRELDYIRKKSNSLATIAGMFCAKEAFFKAVGTGIVLNHLCEVEIGHFQSGAPYYILSPEVIKKNGLSTARIELSISHTKVTAVAVCHIVRAVT